MVNRAEQLPRIFQTNIARLYQRVVQPCLARLPVHDRLVTGEAPDLDTFLDRAAAQVDNYTANEANKVFALMLAAIFERQLRVWAAHVLNGVPGIDTAHMPIESLLAAVNRAWGIDLASDRAGPIIAEAFLVANVVRHGDGRSLQILQSRAGHLWQQQDDYVDLLPGPSPQSEMLRIRSSDLERFVRSMARYWGLADRQPLAVTEGMI